MLTTQDLQAIRGIVTEEIDRRIDEFAVIVARGFEAVDQRFEAMDKRFNAMDARFDAMDQRFDAMDLRFDAMDLRFDALESRVQTIEGTLVYFTADRADTETRLTRLESKAFRG